MTKRQASVRIEVLLYVLLALVAGWLRLSNLDWPPLNDAEAAQALSALEGSSSAVAVWNEVETASAASPAYQALTRFIFQLLGASDASARLVPAIFGLALAFVPLLMRQQLGTGRALATAWLLGISPTLIAASRTASGTTLAAFGLLIAVALALSPERKTSSVWLALALGLTLASGPEAIMALIGFGIAVAVARAQKSEVPSEETPKAGSEGSSFQAWWFFPLVALAIAGGLGLHLRGISGFFDSIAAWLAGWGNPSGVSQLTLWAMLLLYEPLVLAMGVGAAILVWRNQDSRGLAAISWAAVAMLLASIYPARQPSYVIWAVLPLILLGGQALSRLIGQWMETRAGIAVAGLAGMILIVVSYGYLQLAAYSSGYYINPQSPGMVLLFILASVALLVAGILLFGLGWSWGLAWRGASATGTLLLLAFSLSVGYQLAFSPSAAGGRELWRPQASTLGTPMLVETLQSLAVAQSGTTQFLEMELSQDISPGLVWALRDFEEARLLDPFGDASAAVVLVPEYASVSGITDDYVAQVIVVAESWGWTGALPADLVSWWVRREAPVISERWLLYVLPEAFGLEDLES